MIRFQPPIEGVALTLPAQLVVRPVLLGDAGMADSPRILAERVGEVIGGGLDTTWSVRQGPALTPFGNRQGPGVVVELTRRLRRFGHAGEIELQRIAQSEHDVVAGRQSYGRAGGLQDTLAGEELALSEPAVERVAWPDP